MMKFINLIIFILFVLPISLLAQRIIGDEEQTSSLSMCNLQNDAVTYYMQNAYQNGDGARFHNTSQENSLMNQIFQKYDDGKSKHEWTQWPQAVRINTIGGTTLQISNDPSFSKVINSITIKGDITEVYNLVPGQIYYYKILNAKKTIISSGKFATQGRIRMIKMEETCNVRDLGGHLCYDKNGNLIGTTRYNLLYRGALPNSNDIKIANQINIKSQISVCFEEEMNNILDPWKLNNLAYHGNDTYRLNDDNGFFDQSATYSHIATILKKIKENINTNLPTFYHCSAGADRTGGLTLILLGLCGVNEDEILHDYELTSLAPFYIDENFSRSNHRLVTDKGRIGMMLDKLNTLTAKSNVANGTLQEKIEYYLTTWLKTKKSTYVFSKTDIDALKNLLIEPIKPIKEGIEEDIKLNITPFCITPGTEKGGIDGYLGINIERGDALGVTSLTCDIELPTGLSLCNDMPVTLDAQSMPLCTDGGNAPHLYNVSTSISDSKQKVHLECSHRSGLCFEDNEQLAFHLKLKADAKHKNELSEIKLENIIATCTDMSRVILADNHASVLIGEPELENLELEGKYAEKTINDFNSVLSKYENLHTIDLRNIQIMDASTLWQTGNPNTLYYLQPEMEIANSENVVKEGICDNFVLNDMHSFNKLSEDLKASNASYMRNINSKWCTMCLPFAVASTEDAQLYKCKIIDNDIVLLEKTDMAEAGEAFIVANNSEQSTIQFISNNVTITTDCYESSDEESTLKGTLKEKSFTNQNIYYIANNEFWSNKSNTVTIPAYRAWIEPTASAQMKSQLRTFTSEDITTGLDEISNNDIEAIDCYNMMGQKISTNANGMMLIRDKKGSVKKVLFN